MAATVYRGVEGFGVGEDESGDVEVVDAEEERRLKRVRQQRMKRQRPVEFQDSDANVEAKRRASLVLRSRVVWRRRREDGKAVPELSTVDVDRENFFHVVPEDILLTIFSFLSRMPDLWRVAAVCKRWRKVAWDPRLWSEVDFDGHELVNDAVIASMLAKQGALSLTKSIALARCHQVTELAVRSIPVCANALEVVNLSWCSGASDRSVASFSRCEKLRKIMVAHNRSVTRKSIRLLALRCPLLETIDLTCCRAIRDSLLEVIASNCQLLRELSVANAKAISDRAVVNLVKCCREIRKLDLSWCKEISDDSVLSIANFLPKLEELAVSETKVTDWGVEALASKCSALTSLQFARCKAVTDEGISSMCQYLSRTLKYVNLGSCHQVSDIAVTALIRSCTNLEVLDASRLPCRDLASLLDNIDPQRILQVYY